MCEFIKEGKVTHAQIAAMFKVHSLYRFDADMMGLNLSAYC